MSYDYTNQVIATCDKDHENKQTSELKCINTMATKQHNKAFYYSDVHSYVYDVALKRKNNENYKAADSTPASLDNRELNIYWSTKP